MPKIFGVLYAVFLFFLLPLAAYRAASFYTDEYFRLKTIPYPSEDFVLAAGLGACFWTLGTSFFIHAYFFKKRGDKS